MVSVGNIPFFQKPAPSLNRKVNVKIKLLVLPGAIKLNAPVNRFYEMTNSLYSFLTRDSPSLTNGNAPVEKMLIPRVK